MSFSFKFSLASNSALNNIFITQIKYQINFQQLLTFGTKGSDQVLLV